MNIDSDMIFILEMSNYFHISQMFENIIKDAFINNEFKVWVFSEAQEIHHVFLSL